MKKSYQERKMEITEQRLAEFQKIAARLEKNERESGE